jgi:T5orf172 domain
MSFASHTPEALLPRSDSKNPATTCKGITANGRPCRRSLASSPRSSPGPSPLKDRGVLAILRDEQDDGNAAAAFYCWQHKDQAEMVAKSQQNHTELFPLRERTSIDTLVDRVGVLDIQEDNALKETRHRRRKTRDGKSTARADLPADWQRMQGPLMSVPSDLMSPTTMVKPQRRSQAPRSNVKASLFCCVRDAGDDELPPPRHRPHPMGNVVSSQKTTLPVIQVRSPSQTASPFSTKPASTPTRSAPVSPGLRTPSTPVRPGSTPTPQSTGSQTQGLLSLIPPHLSPQTTSVLLNELSKPISSADAEGYIYIFWLTPESDTSKPDDDAASDLLEPATTRPPSDRKRIDVLHRYASQRRGPTQPKTVLLKIGRAENVHRRLSQWSKQCSYNITLIRYYPYTPSSRTPPHSDTQILPRKVPHVHRVERLVHVELAEKRVTEQGACETCGREHKEWFEIEASRDGLRAVDEVIRRWVRWAERQE